MNTPLPLHKAESAPLLSQLPVTPDGFAARLHQLPPTPARRQAGDGVGLGDTVHTHNGRQNSGYSDTKIIDSRWIRLVE